VIPEHACGAVFRHSPNHVEADVIEKLPPRASDSAMAARLCPARRVMNECEMRWVAYAEELLRFVIGSCHDVIQVQPSTVEGCSIMLFNCIACCGAASDRFVRTEFKPDDGGCSISKYE